MILWPHSLWVHLSLLHVLFAVSFVIAADDQPFDCTVTIGKSKWDLTALKGEKSIDQMRDSPPGKMKDELIFDLCEDLKLKDDLRDLCPEGTRFCLTETFQKDSSETLTAVIPIAQSSLFKPAYEALESPKGVSVTLHGPAWPNSNGTEQLVVVKVLCEKEGQDKPDFVSYEDRKTLNLQWKSPSGCMLSDDDKDVPPSDGEDKPGDDSGDGHGGSGVSFFFLVLILAVLAYFGLGAYYNYTTYGASGADLIPHRDFWREVPYMFKDVISHLCSSVRSSRPSRGGYISV